MSNFNTFVSKEEKKEILKEEIYKENLGLNRLEKINDVFELKLVLQDILLKEKELKQVN